jgi:hypothetical protein
MTKSVILKTLMTTFFIAAAIIFAIRSFHRFVMRSVDEHGHTAAVAEKPRHDDYLYVGTHTDFKRRSKV